ncbi:MAG: adenosylcobalamin-dependent ribonucleoside-diphosphate reductase [Candidatus Xenobia bacterium]
MQQVEAKGMPSGRGHWTDAAMRVMRERYLRQGETPEQMLWRVARAVANAESRFGVKDPRPMAEAFYELMLSRRFMPNSPTLMNAGRDNALQYSACYVLPIEDSLDGIFEAIKRAAIIHQSGGGTGFAFSRLRPRDTPVVRSGGRASGPVSFLRVFDAATEAVKQGGTRRGANMGILRCDHPDILEFVDCKLDGGISNFNISVAATETFMQAVDEDAPYAVVDPHTGKEVARAQAREVFNRIVAAAWQTGDPGLVFIDRVNRSPANPIPTLSEIEATNPCGEQPLAPNEACNLGSLNLAAFLEGDRIDWSVLEGAVRTAVRFLDDVIEVNPYPLPEIDTTVKANRRIGLGVMGWADLLVALGIPYDSDRALQLAGEVMAFIQRVGHDASSALAVERGAFPHWEQSIYRQQKPLRNATVTTIAPTGSISIIAGCSAGIEPLFAVAFSHVVGDRHLSFVQPGLEKVLPADAMAQVVRTGSLAGVEQVPEEVRRVYVTAHQISPEWHVRMQAAFQRHTDNGVSKTINLPRQATRQDVADAYLLAWKLGCLGITVYRDGCKATQVLYAGTQAPDGISPRPRQAAGSTYRVETPIGTAYVTVNQAPDGQPLEVFLNVGKAGSDTAAVSEAIGRLLSLCLRLPSPLSPRQRVQEIVSQLSGIGGARQTGVGPQKVRSLPDAIAQVLAEHLGAEDPSAAHGDLCPQCGQAALIAQEGCQKCAACGFTLC